MSFYLAEFENCNSSILNNMAKVDSLHENDFFGPKGIGGQRVVRGAFVAVQCAGIPRRVYYVFGVVKTWGPASFGFGCCTMENSVTVTTLDGDETIALPKDMICKPADILYAALHESCLQAVEAVLSSKNSSERLALILATRIPTNCEQFWISQRPSYEGMGILDLAVFRTGVWTPIFRILNRYWRLPTVPISNSEDAIACLSIVLQRGALVTDQILMRACLDSYKWRYQIDIPAEAIGLLLQHRYEPLSGMFKYNPDSAGGATVLANALGHNEAAQTKVLEFMDRSLQIYRGRCKRCVARETTSDSKPIKESTADTSTGDSSNDSSCSSDHMCPVCWEDIDSDNYYQLPCGHVFCSDCLEPVIWKMKQDMCPLCRHQFA